MKINKKCQPLKKVMTIDDIIFLVEIVINKNYDKETLRISSYWDLRDSIDDFWVYVDRGKELGLTKFKELYRGM
jgi:hypothetical protein